jgi:hypothetical protein
VASETTVVGRVLAEDISDIESKVNELEEWRKTLDKGIPFVTSTTVRPQSIIAGLSAWVLGLL